MLVCPRCRSIYDVPVLHCGIDGERTVEQEEDPLINQVLDRYRIVGRLGRGAMGIVYRAAHTVLRREYAIKVLFGELGSNGEFVQRLRREAESVSMIKHPNVIVMEDFGTTALGVNFLVMELVQGVTLADALSTSGPFPPKRVANIGRQMASGLAEAHRVGLVHRDVKPSNVMITAEDGVKLLDFGVVSVLSPEAEEARSRLTTEGALIGTPMYMAPEQVEAAKVTFAADLYSMGIILYELLVGQPPFRGTPTDVLVQQIAELPEPLPPSAGLETVVDRLLAKRPEDRPGSAFEVIEAIDALGLADIPQVLPTQVSPLRARELDDEADQQTVTELDTGLTEDVGTSPGDVMRDTADVDLQATHHDSDGLARSRASLSPADLGMLQGLTTPPIQPAFAEAGAGASGGPARVSRTEVLNRPRAQSNGRETARRTGQAEYVKIRPRNGSGAPVLDRPVVERGASDRQLADPRSDLEVTDTGYRLKTNVEAPGVKAKRSGAAAKLRRMFLLALLLVVTGLVAVFLAQHGVGLLGGKSAVSPGRSPSLP